jgi:hypothetical protein
VPCCEGGDREGFGGSGEGGAEGAHLGDIWSWEVQVRSWRKHWATNFRRGSVTLGWRISAIPATAIVCYRYWCVDGLSVSCISQSLRAWRPSRAVIMREYNCWVLVERWVLRLGLEDLGRVVEVWVWRKVVG